MEAIESFAADVSHELKNPLTSLRSAVETLPIATTDEQRARLLGVIKHDVRRLDRLITDISDASRLDAELAREATEPVDIAQAAGDGGVDRARDARAEQAQDPAHARAAALRQGRLLRARPRQPARPGLQQPDRQRAVLLAAGGQRAHPRLARADDDLSSRSTTTVPASAPRTSRASSSASTPTARRPTSSARIPGSASPSRGRSSRRIAARSAPRTGCAADGSVEGARFTVILPGAELRARRCRKRSTRPPCWSAPTAF